MPKKKEPTGTTPVTENPKKSTTASAAAKPATAKPASTTKAAKKPAASATKPTAKATEKSAATPAKAEKPATPAKATEKSAATPAKAEKPATPAKAEKPATPGAQTTAIPEKPLDQPNPVITVIIAKFDVGPGNNLYIRGDGHSLDWDKGALMENTGGDIWRWSTTEAREGVLAFKLLINDETWSTGENMNAPFGETSTYYPAF